MTNLNHTTGTRVADAIDKRIINVAKQVYDNSPNDKMRYGTVVSKDAGVFSVKINNTTYSNIKALRNVGDIAVGEVVHCLVPNNNFSDMVIIGVADGTLDIRALKDLSNVTYPEIVYDEETGKFDGIAHQGAGDRVIETYISSDGNTWYRKWASGWKECGGYSTLGLYLFKKTIVLPNITFTNTYYTIMITPENRGTGEDTYSWWLEESITTSQFTVRMRVNTPTIRYYCCGY